MTFEAFWQQLATDLHHTSWLEFIAVITGIGSVWFSRAENILVYPVGLINTIIYIYISFQNHLIGEASVNLYYTIMSIYGWILWARRNDQNEHVVQVTWSGQREWAQQLAFFGVFYISIFFVLTYLKKNFYPGVIPFGDAFATATAFTGMWLMAKKKVESWYWWIATNLASVPLYFIKHLPLTSIYYSILLVLAIFGLIEWRRRAKKMTRQTAGHPH